MEYTELDRYKAEMELLRPITNGWDGKIKKAITARKGFDDVAEQCEAFFSGALNFMWEGKFANKHFTGKLQPKFRITLQKAFELVAVFGPTLYARNPIRTILPRTKIDIEPEMFGTDEQAQYLYQAALEDIALRDGQDKIVAQLLSKYLNYTPDEQPYGGLAQHAELAITQALVTGRGCLWPEHYKMPGSDRTLTGCFYDSNKNLLIDPDASGLHDAWWIARKCTQPIWKVEREYGLKPGTLKKSGHYESANYQGASQADETASHKRAKGESNDLIVYYKIWSKMGPGARLEGVHDSDLANKLDKLVGDYAYLVIAPDVPFPLNAPPKALSESSDEEIAEMFEWPVPFWRDDRWPVVCIDFYRHPEKAWPIAPMGPGLGELAYMNVFISMLAGRAWQSTRTIAACIESAKKHVEPALKSGNETEVITIPREAAQTIQEAVSYLQQPDIKPEAWQIIDRLTDAFERRTGLTELVYGLNPGGVASRTATDAEAKTSATQVRPDYMAGRVEDAMSEAADLEKFCARWFVEADDIEDFFGPVGAYLWTKHVTDVDPEVVVREMRATVEAGSARKPNKQREAQNINTVLPVMFPELSKQADITGDTEPLNALIRMWGKAIDMDVKDMLMGPRAPEPSEEQMAAEQQAQQMEMAKQQAEIEGKQMDAQSKAMDLAIKQQMAQEEAKKAQLDAALDLQRHQQALGFDLDKHKVDMATNLEDHKLGMLIQRQKHEQQMAQARAQDNLKLRKAKESVG